VTALHHSTDGPSGSIFGFSDRTGGKTTTLRLLTGWRRHRRHRLRAGRIGETGEPGPQHRLSRPGPALLRLDERRELLNLWAAPRPGRTGLRNRVARCWRSSADIRGASAHRRLLGGMRQRLGIGQPSSTSRGPVLDEPVSSLDPEAGAMFWTSSPSSAHGHRLHEHPHPQRRGTGLRPGGDPQLRPLVVRGPSTSSSTATPSRSMSSSRTAPGRRGGQARGGDAGQPWRMTSRPLRTRSSSSATPDRRPGNPALVLQVV